MFPQFVNIANQFRPTWRRHRKRLEEYLVERAHQARERARKIGAEVAVETAISTLDLIVARELREGIIMTDQEMRDELYLCMLL